MVFKSKEPLSKAKKKQNRHCECWCSSVLLSVFQACISSRWCRRWLSGGTPGMTTSEELPMTGGKHPVSIYTHSGPLINDSQVSADMLWQVVYWVGLVFLRNDPALVADPSIITIHFNCIFTRKLVQLPKKTVTFSLIAITFCGSCWPNEGIQAIFTLAF